MKDDMKTNLLKIQMTLVASKLELQKGLFYFHIIQCFLSYAISNTLKYWSIL